MCPSCPATGPWPNTQHGPWNNSTLTFVTGCRTRVQRMGRATAIDWKAEPRRRCGQCGSRLPVVKLWWGPRLPHMCLRKTSALLPGFVSHAQTNNYVINVSRYRLIDIEKFVLYLLSLPGRSSAPDRGSLRCAYSFAAGSTYTYLLRRRKSRRIYPELRRMSSVNNLL